MPLASLLALLRSRSVLGRLEVEVRSGVAPLYTERPPRLSADLPEDLVRTIHDDARHAVAIARTPCALFTEAQPGAARHAHFVEVLCRLALTKVRVRVRVRVS